MPVISIQPGIRVEGTSSKTGRFTVPYTVNIPKPSVNDSARPPVKKKFIINMIDVSTSMNDPAHPDGAATDGVAQRTHAQAPSSSSGTILSGPSNQSIPRVSPQAPSSSSMTIMLNAQPLPPSGPSFVGGGGGGGAASHQNYPTASSSVSSFYSVGSSSSASSTLGSVSNSMMYHGLPLRPRVPAPMSVGPTLIDLAKEATVRVASSTKNMADKILGFMSVEFGHSEEKDVPINTIMLDKVTYFQDLANLNAKLLQVTGTTGTSILPALAKIREELASKAIPHGTEIVLFIETDGDLNDSEILKNQGNTNKISNLIKQKLDPDNHYIFSIYHFRTGAYRAQEEYYFSELAKPNGKCTYLPVENFHNISTLVSQALAKEVDALEGTVVLEVDFLEENGEKVAKTAIEDLGCLPFGQVFNGSISMPLDLFDNKIKSIRFTPWLAANALPGTPRELIFDHPIEVPVTEENRKAILDVTVEDLNTRRLTDPNAILETLLATTSQKFCVVIETAGTSDPQPKLTQLAGRLETFIAEQRTRCDEEKIKLAEALIAVLRSYQSHRLATLHSNPQQAETFHSVMTYTHSHSTMSITTQPASAVVTPQNQVGSITGVYGRPNTNYNPDAYKRCAAVAVQLPIFASCSGAPQLAPLSAPEKPPVVAVPALPIEKSATTITPGVAAIAMHSKVAPALPSTPSPASSLNTSKPRLSATDTIRPSERTFGHPDPNKTLPFMFGKPAKPPAATPPTSSLVPNRSTPDTSTINTPSTTSTMQTYSASSSFLAPSAASNSRTPPVPATSTTLKTPFVGPAPLAGIYSAQDRNERGTVADMPVHSSSSSFQAPPVTIPSAPSVPLATSAMPPSSSATDSLHHPAASISSTPIVALPAHSQATPSPAGSFAKPSTPTLPATTTTTSSLVPNRPASEINTRSATSSMQASSSSSSFLAPSAASNSKTSAAVSTSKVTAPSKQEPPHVVASNNLVNNIPDTTPAMTTTATAEPIQKTFKWFADKFNTQYQNSKNEKDRVLSDVLNQLAKEIDRLGAATFDKDLAHRKQMVLKNYEKAVINAIVGNNANTKRYFNAEHVAKQLQIEWAVLNDRATLHKDRYSFTWLGPVTLFIAPLIAMLVGLFTLSLDRAKQYGAAFTPQKFGLFDSQTRSERGVTTALKQLDDDNSRAQQTI